MISHIRPRTPRSDYLVRVAQQLIAPLTTSELRAAFLFGSAAWGDADAASDLDIMLVLDRPAPYREVNRMRPDALMSSPVPDGPHFADLDRISVDTFSDAVREGRWFQRIVHSVVLADTDAWYAQLRAQVCANYLAPVARLARFEQKRTRVGARRAALRQIATEDAEMAALHAVLLLEEAAGALLEVANERVSRTHNVESLQQTLVHLNHPHLFLAWCRLLGLEAGPAGVSQSQQAFRIFANALQAWMAEPAIGVHLSVEDRAWAALTYSQETFDEIAQKVTLFQQANRLPALQHYLDGLLLVSVQRNIGKVLQIKANGATGDMDIRDFHAALRAYPHLYETWVTALRLRPLGDQLRRADDVAVQLLQIGEQSLKATLSISTSVA